MFNIAVILAGGMGSRVGGDMPKQLLPLADGRSILEHTVKAFEAARVIDEILIVMHPDYISTVRDLCEDKEWRKVTKIIPGGKERWESSWHAIEAICRETKVDQPIGEKVYVSLWFHDCARPFVSARILTDVSAALREHPAVTVAVPVTDTLYKVKDERKKGEGILLESVPSRSEYMRAQTPQAFHLNVIYEAFKRALAGGNIGVTDDVGIVRSYMPEIPIYIVEGEEKNRKITYKEDIK